MRILWNEYFDKLSSISLNTDLTNLYELESGVLDLLVRITQVKVQKVKDLWFVDFTSTDLIVLQLVPSVWEHFSLELRIVLPCYYFLLTWPTLPLPSLPSALTWYCKVDPTFQSSYQSSLLFLGLPSPPQCWSWWDWGPGQPRPLPGPPSLEPVLPSC